MAAPLSKMTDRVGMAEEEEELNSWNPTTLIYRKKKIGQPPQDSVTTSKVQGSISKKTKEVAHGATHDL